MDTKFSDKYGSWAVITGASSGIGVEFAHQIAEKGLNIHFAFDQKNELLVPYYYTNLIINNILINAIKYSKKDSNLKISVEEIDNHVTCTILDEGLGIKEEDLKRIYDNFFRSDAMDHKQISGNGLGLSIVKKCADAIEAKINISSVLGKGTCVTITF